MTAPENKIPNLRETRKEMAAVSKAAARPNVTPLTVAENAGRPANPGRGVAEKAIGKSAAKKAPPAKKVAAKKAPPRPTTPRDAQHPWYVKSSYKPVKGKKLWEATGESGQISVYSSDQVMTHAVSLAEPDRPGADHLKNGRICSMHTSKELAEKMVERLMKDRAKDDHTRAVVVEAREYRGQGEEKQSSDGKTEKTG